MSRIKELRKKQGLSQQELANKLNVHQTAISQWENDRTAPDIENLQHMAKLFNVSTDYLLGCVTSAPIPNSSEVDLALSNTIQKLTDDEKQDLLDYVRFKLFQRAK